VPVLASQVFMSKRLMALYLAAILVIVSPFILILVQGNSIGAVPILFGGGIVITAICERRLKFPVAVAIGGLWILLAAILIAVGFPAG
jgi:hypothetical protein